MKRFAILFLISLFLLPGCKKEVQDADAEIDAIKSVIKQETSSYLNQDLVNLVKTWANTENAIRISVGSNGYKEYAGWEKVYSFFKASANADWKDYTNYRVERSNWRFEFCGDGALVFFDQNMYFDFKGEPMNTFSKEFRFMEKIRGDWKIVLLQWIDMSSFMEEGETDVKTF